MLQQFKWKIKSILYDILYRFKKADGGDTYIYEQDED